MKLNKPGSRADPQGELPYHRTGGADHAAAILRSRQRQRVGFTVGRLQREMVMPVPSAAREPQTQSVILSWGPLELQAVTGLFIVDRRRAFAERRGKDLGAVSLGHIRIQSVNPRVAVQQRARGRRQLKLVARLQA